MLLDILLLVVGLSFSWTDTAFFTTNLNRYDYIDYAGFGLKVDKNADAARLGIKQFKLTLVLDSPELL